MRHLSSRIVAWACLFLGFPAHAGEKMAMPTPKAIHIAAIEISVRRYSVGGGREIVAHELVAHSLKSADRTEPLWTYRAPTLPNNVLLMTKVGEYQPVFMRFTSLKAERGAITATYRQGFISANDYGVTDPDGRFKTFQDFPIQLDPTTGRELAR